ncbi:MAG: hypothetical protein A2Z64_03175 [Betaproteobacteria bacterium RIFCSPLOWO2_02_67_12]|nr:MAG: hypothetical protein A2Z64_03175 [Betaproteobacteria bacterium RIFCSPLOWO2_02_67_12]OGA64099.1 MAG: hypothetical protein A3F77_10735 [Betaproteobacteria bacterium RIFCSPLOWO2_12_FULL_67_28]
MSSALVDTGPLVAWFDKSDPDFRRARRFFASFKGQLFSTWPVLTEVSHLVPPYVSDRMLGWVGDGGVVLVDLPAESVLAMRQTMARYADNPMDLADASLLWLGDQLDLTEVITLDRGFSAFRTPSGRALRNLFPSR